MFKSVSECESAMRSVLKQLCDCAALEKLSLPEDDGDRDAAVMECVNKGCISGVTYDYTQDGKPHFTTDNLRVTHSGLSFMELG